MSAHSYRVQDSRVVSETLEGETILVNLDTGVYYSMNETAAFIWEKLGKGYSDDQIVASLEAFHEGSRSAIEQSVRDTIALFESEQLIAATEEAGAGTVEEAAAEKEPFVAALIESHTDMQETLLADPIHDVDPGGWPKLKQ